jgi:hypothetical protein
VWADVCTKFYDSWTYTQAYPLLQTKGSRLNVLSTCTSFLQGPFAKIVDSLLLQVRTLWRCSDGLFFRVPPLSSDALLTTFHPPLENVLHTIHHFEISCLGAPFSWLKKRRILMGRDLDCMVPNQIQNAIQILPHVISGLSNHEKGAPRQEILK